MGRAGVVVVVVVVFGVATGATEGAGIGGNSTVLMGADTATGAPAAPPVNARPRLSPSAPTLANTAIRSRLIAKNFGPFEYATQETFGPATQDAGSLTLGLAGR